MRGTGRTNELTLTSVVMSDARADAGRTKFLSVGCNAGANASFGDGGNRNFNTNVEGGRNPNLAGIPKDGGFLTTPNSDGSFGDHTFNAPPLIEAADTGPFFHTAVTISGASAHNTDFARTIEEAIAFYDSPAFNTGRPVPIDLTADEIDNIGRFLRGLNATFNAAIALKRIDAELGIMAYFHDTALDTQREMLRLAEVEINDALGDLTQIPASTTSATAALNPTAQSAFATANKSIEVARMAAHETDRVAALQNARQMIVQAASSIGTNLTYNIAEGVTMF